MTYEIGPISLSGFSGFSIFAIFIAATYWDNKIKTKMWKTVLIYFLSFFALFALVFSIYSHYNTYSMFKDGELENTKKVEGIVKSIEIIGRDEVVEFVSGGKYIEAHISQGGCLSGSLTKYGVDVGDKITVVYKILKNKENETACKLSLTVE